MSAARSAIARVGNLARALAAIPGEAFTAVVEFDAALGAMPPRAGPDQIWAERVGVVLGVLERSPHLPRRDLSYMALDIVDALAVHESKGDS